MDIAERKWTRLETTCRGSNDSPGPRSSHTIFPYKGDLYVWGGMNRHNRMNLPNNFDSKLYRLKNVASDKRVWEVVKTSAQRPAGREEHAGVLYKGKFYIFGGKLGGPGKALTNDLWVLNLSNFKWKALKSSDGPGRHLHQMWAAKNKLYVLGGRTKVYKREVNGRMDFRE